MKLRYFRVDDDARVRRISQRHIEGAFLERRRWSQPADYSTLRIVTFICDGRLLPVEAYFLRAEVEEGRIADESRYRLVAFFQSMAASGLTLGHVEKRLIGEQRTGWPRADVLLPNLAQALDVPVSALPEFHLGGPLVLALAMGISVRQGLTYRSELIRKINARDRADGDVGGLSDCDGS
jgi:hypothetical protein